MVDSLDDSETQDHCILFSGYSILNRTFSCIIKFEIRDTDMENILMKYHVDSKLYLGSKHFHILHNFVAFSLILKNPLSLHVFRNSLVLFIFITFNAQGVMKKF